jgi:cyclomaltodextrinase
MTIMLEALYHRPGQNWSYAYNDSTLHIRIRTKRGNVPQIQLFCGDKFDWDKYNEAIWMEHLASDTLFDYWQAAVTPKFRRLVYYFELYSENQDIVYYLEKGFFNEHPAIKYEGLFDFPFLNPEDVHTPPEWVKEAIFYQIFPERFANGDPSINPKDVCAWGDPPSPNNFFGGDLQGVIDHLDHLSELGINAIYFNPLFEATTNHKYDTSDYMRIDPHFGTEEKLKELVEACHARGIRVLLDGVFNHCGRTFPPFADVLENGEKSKYAAWFHIRQWPLHVANGIASYDTFGFEPIMPKLNTGNEEVREYLLNVGRYWIEEFGIDGWRLDVANEVDHQFWRDFRREVKSVNPSAYLLGEIMHDSILWMQGDQFDAAMNYPFTNILLNFFARKLTTAEQFALAINAQLASYPQQVNEVAFNLLGSHDTTRLLTLCQGNVSLMKLATLFQLTFQGAPCVYYGDEIGIDGEHDPHNRKCMEWDKAKQNTELFQFFREMISLRKQYEALRGSGLRFISIPEHPQLLVYERWNDTDRFMIVLNNQAQAAEADIPTGVPSRAWRTIHGEATIELSEELLQITVPPYGYSILQALSAR